MSSTSRGGKRSPADFYATPGWPVRRLLKRLALPMANATWFEPAAGDGAIIKAVNAYYQQATQQTRVQGPHWVANELRPECRLELDALARLRIGDFFELPPPPRGDVDVTITNPPFSLAMEMIEHSLKFSPWVIHLLRLNFFGSQKRNEFFQREMPDVYVIPDRVSFAQSASCSSCDWSEIYPLNVEVIRVCGVCGCKVNISTTDSIEYGWFVWTPERGRRRGAIEVLACTSDVERKVA